MKPADVERIWEALRQVPVTNLSTAVGDGLGKLLSDARELRAFEAAVERGLEFWVL